MGRWFDPSRAHVLLDRSYFALQDRFARRVVEVAGIELVEAYRAHTAFYALARDNDAGMPSERNDFDPEHPAWRAFVAGVEAGADPVDLVDDAYRTGDGTQEEPHCFTFEVWPDDGLVRIHFGNDDAGTGLRPETAHLRRQELTDIVTAVARDHPDATTVRGTSWLYHLEAYRRLLPPAFVATRTSVGHPHQFAALWGQFLDRHGVVKAHLAESFLTAVDEATTLAQLDAAFPLDVLATESPVDVFLDHYGVAR